MTHVLGRELSQAARPSGSASRKVGKDVPGSGGQGYIRVWFMYWPMGFKTVTISDEAYRKLRRLKAKGESFTQVVLRLSEGRSDILRHAGGWKDMADKEANDLTETLREMWSRWKPQGSA